MSPGPGSFASFRTVHETQRGMHENVRRLNDTVWVCSHLPQAWHGLCVLELATGMAQFLCAHPCHRHGACANACARVHHCMHVPCMACCGMATLLRLGRMCARVHVHVQEDIMEEPAPRIVHGPGQPQASCPMPQPHGEEQSIPGRLAGPLVGMQDVGGVDRLNTCDGQHVGGIDRLNTCDRQDVVGVDRLNTCDRHSGLPMGFRVTCAMWPGARRLPLPSTPRCVTCAIWPGARRLPLPSTPHPCTGHGRAAAHAIVRAVHGATAGRHGVQVLCNPTGARHMEGLWLVKLTLNPQLACALCCPSLHSTWDCSGFRLRSSLGPLHVLSRGQTGKVAGHSHSCRRPPCDDAAATVFLPSDDFTSTSWRMPGLSHAVLPSPLLMAAFAFACTKHYTALRMLVILDLSNFKVKFNFKLCSRPCPFSALLPPAPGVLLVRGAAPADHGCWDARAVLQQRQGV
eukprot:366131-Chlamydomonas_euryale.AAC.9